MLEQEENKLDAFLDDSEGSLKDFIDDDDEEDDTYSDNSAYSGSSTSKKSSKSKKSKKGGATTPEKSQSDTYYLMEKKAEELQIYCKTIFRTDYSKNKNFEKEQLKKVFDQIVNVDDISLATLRRLAYAIHFAQENKKDAVSNSTLKFPHQFLESLKPGYFKMSEEMQKSKRDAKTADMKALLTNHFTKQIIAEQKRQPRDIEIQAQLSNPEVQAHAERQIQEQMEIDIEKFHLNECNRIQREQMQLIEGKIKQDASVKAKTDALSHFDEGIGYDYNCDNIQIDVGCKLYFIIEMLERCESRGEKLVVATQRMDVLDQLEMCLEQLSIKNKKDKSKNKTRVVRGFGSDDETGRAEKIKLKTTTRIGQWKKSIDYFRIDGGVSVERRMDAVHSFNNKNNTKAR